MSQLEPTVTEQRRLTRNSIYRYILESESPVSKQQMAQNLGYSLPTIHQNIQELLNADLIRVGEVQRSTGGRPPVGYTIVEDARYAIGVAVSSNHLRFLVSDLKRQQIAYKSIRLEDEEHVDTRIVKETEIFIKENKIEPEKILGVGITIPGIFDFENDRIVTSPTLHMPDFSLKRIQEDCRFPVYIVNDSKSAGIAELLNRPHAEQKKPFAYLLLENGVGGAIAMEGQILSGDNHRSAEFGHMCVEPGGLECNCGRKGCLEAYCSAFRFTRDIGLTTEEFFDGLQEGKKELVDLWEDVLVHMAIGILNIRMCYDSEVILGGFVAENMVPYLGHLRELVAERDPFSENGDYVSIGKLQRAGMVGAAWHFIGQFVEEI